MTNKHVNYKKYCGYINSQNKLNLQQPLNLIPDDPLYNAPDEIFASRYDKSLNETITPVYHNIYHCGFAFAANRSLWTSGIKLYPYYLLGGGDVSLIFNVISEDTDSKNVKQANYQAAQSFEPFLKWTPAFYRYINKKTGYISGSVYHEYHGSKSCRKHGVRQKLIDEHNFDLNSNLYLNNGLLEIKDKHFVNVLKQYFESRKEDN